MRSTLGFAIARALLMILAGGLFQDEAFTQESSESLSVAEAQAILAKQGTELTDADLARICRARELSELDLSGCNQITSKGLSCVAESVGHPEPGRYGIFKAAVDMTLRQLSREYAPRGLRFFSIAPSGLPYTLAIDASGQIVDRQAGAAGEERFDEMMRKALGL